MKVTERSNRNPVRLQDLAEGMQVAGGVFNQAGLTVQEYTGIVGTAVAKTQRSGNEMARAWRTILLQMQRIRGTTDEGEVIDIPEWNKAGEAIEGLGVAMTYVEDGITKMRPQMQILEELAVVWGQLSEEGRNLKQMQLTEALGGKHKMPQRIERCA